MILERGNMWDVFDHTNLFLITTNPIIRKDGAVVMGRGIAKEAAIKFPDLPYRFAKRLESIKGVPHCNVIGTFGNTTIGFFMVKDHWRNPADLQIIEQSVHALRNGLYMKSILGEWTHGTQRVDLNFPGIGNGKLKREDVLPLLEELPDNVHVWEYDA